AYKILNNISTSVRGRGNLTLSIGHDVLKVGMLHHSPSDPKKCMQMEEGDPVKIAPPDKSAKKKSKEDKGKSINIGEFTHIPTVPHFPYPSVLVGSNTKASAKDASNQYFEPP
ncbi:hypothetical protein PIB30_093110, partial [Stylosanthes scabra]|nr:hypothetical protein [Stylosanthes scabra]